MFLEHSVHFLDRAWGISRQEDGLTRLQVDYTNPTNDREAGAVLALGRVIFEKGVYC